MVDAVAALRALAEAAEAAADALDAPAVPAAPDAPVLGSGPPVDVPPIVASCGVEFVLAWSSADDLGMQDGDYTAQGRDLMVTNPWWTQWRDTAQAKKVRAGVYVKYNEVGTPFGDASQWGTGHQSGWGALLDTNNPGLHDAAVANTVEMCDDGWDLIWIDNILTLPDGLLVRLIEAAHGRGKRIGGNFVTLDSQAQLAAAKHLVDLGCDFTFNEFMFGGAWNGGSWAHPEDLCKQWADYSIANGAEWHVRVAAGTDRADWLHHCWESFALWNVGGLGRFTAVSYNVGNDPRHTWKGEVYR